MAARDLVTGGVACAVTTGSSSNPFGSLANAIIGASSKTQETLREIPTSIPNISSSSVSLEKNDYFTSLPGSEFDHSSSVLPVPDVLSKDFLRSFHSANDREEFLDAWDDISHARNSQSHIIDQGPSELYAYDNNRASNLQHPPQLNEPPQRVLSNVLRSFIGSSHGSIPFCPASLPELCLSDGDKQCIRDRSSIMARHFFADRSEDFIDAQVNALLSALDIDHDIKAKGPVLGRYKELEEYWNESLHFQKNTPYSENKWVSEYWQHNPDLNNPQTLTRSLEPQSKANGWASEFSQEQSQMTHTYKDDALGSAGFEQSRMLANTLAQNRDPKFQNSKFLQFVSKMSRGEFIIDENQLKPTSVSDRWAAEYQTRGADAVPWADEFLHRNDNNMPSHGAATWAEEFGLDHTLNSLDNNEWVNEFSKINIGEQLEEFENEANRVWDEASAENWANAYDGYLSEQITGKNPSDISRAVYVFSDVNPYVGHPYPLKEGQDLFRRGLLSEAVLALEAEVIKNPQNAEGWRLLGVTHAENDDDQQAIASMMHAHEVDPTNLEVLLALGVSYTNELEQADALKYLHKWLHHHPRYGVITRGGDPLNSPYHADVVRWFKEAVEMCGGEDGDVHVVLGVLYNLSREYDKAIQSFHTALKLKPLDYSLWNKLGATQANSVSSHDAISAYQRALDLKPNYVRAWANMGISFANQGRYRESIKYYVRALSMNPKADNAWQYLKISLGGGSRSDMLQACEDHRIDILEREFPL